MPRIIRFSDSSFARFATIILDSGEPIWISFAQSEVTVKISKLGFLGPRIYADNNLGAVARLCEALAFAFEDDLTPPDITNPCLKAFANAVLHCKRASEVGVLLNTPPDQLPRNYEAKLGSETLKQFLAAKP